MLWPTLLGVLSLCLQVSCHDLIPLLQQALDGGRAGATASSKVINIINHGGQRPVTVLPPGGGGTVLPPGGDVPRKPEDFATGIHDYEWSSMEKWTRNPQYEDRYQDALEVVYSVYIFDPEVTALEFTITVFDVPSSPNCNEGYLILEPMERFCNSNPPPEEPFVIQLDHGQTIYSFFYVTFGERYSTANFEIFVRQLKG